MELKQALTWASGRQNAVLITIRADGRPQSSDITYFVDGDELVISVTETRAKTKNLRRDNRAVLHITDPSSWSYVSLDGVAQLSPPAASPDDTTVEALVDYYRALSGDHSNWDEYRQAMVDEGRLIIRFQPGSATGQIQG